MSSVTSIEWTSTHHPDGTVTPGRTWNPVRGCQVVSPGCKNCYAMKFAHRFHGPGQPYEGLTQMTSGGPVWTGRARTVPEALAEPLKWRKPCRVFVNSMSDLFHEDVPFWFISDVLKMCLLASRHTFQIITKRPERLLEYHRWTQDDSRSCIRLGADILPNVWLGVSAEDQRRADERIPLLLEVPAAVRFVSCEPLLGEIDLRGERVDWVIVGGESGPGARPMHPDWARALRDQCVNARVPYFFKQRGEWTWDYPQGVSLAHREETYQHGVSFYRVGKSMAGRQLDGREWNEFPEVRS